MRNYNLKLRFYESFHVVKFCGGQCEHLVVYCSQRTHFQVFLEIYLKIFHLTEEKCFLLT